MVISGGQLVATSGAGALVGSTADTYSASDIHVQLIPDSDYCNGIAIDNAASGGNVTIATRGMYLMRAGDPLSGGTQVYPVSGVDTGQQYVANVPVNLNYSGTIIGRVIISAASGTNSYGLIDLNV